MQVLYLSLQRDSGGPTFCADEHAQVGITS